MTIIFKVDTGELISASEHPMNQAQIDMMLLGGGKDYIDGYCQIDDGYVKNYELKLKPEKPSDEYLFNLKTERWELSPELALEAALAKRLRLLLQSDYTQLPDVVIANREEWAVYRQELRDVSSQPGFPEDIIWPVPPTNSTNP